MNCAPRRETPKAPMIGRFDDCRGSTGGTPTEAPSRARRPEYELPEAGKTWWRWAARPPSKCDGNDKAKPAILPSVAAERALADTVGLEPGSEEQIKKDLQSIEAAGGKRPYVDIAGPSGKRILAVVIETPRQTWFVKMMGPTALVGKQKPAFEALVRSLKFDGDRGAE